MDLMEKEKLEQKVEESRKSYAQNGHLKDFDEDFIRAEIKWEMLQNKILRKVKQVEIMRKYTVETLKKENELFDRCYGINNADVERVNHLIDMIEKTRSVESIQAYDVVEYTNEYGEYFPKATVTMKEEEDIELCENAGIHLSIYDNELCGSASGGAFSHHKESEFVYKGTAVKTFWTWGNVGARANGGIYFTATVNLWECNNNKEMFSTKTHDKYYLSHRKSDNDYQYFASWNALSSHAWKTKRNASMVKNLQSRYRWKTYMGRYGYLDI